MLAKLRSGCEGSSQGALNGPGDSGATVALSVVLGDNAADGLGVCGDGMGVAHRMGFRGRNGCA